MKRELSGAEKIVISRIADKISDPKRRQQLLGDMANASAETVLADGSRTTFHIAGYQRPRYEGQHSFGIEGKTVDSDGAELWIDLFADQNDRLLELSIIKVGPGKIVDPDWKALELF